METEKILSHEFAKRVVNYKHDKEIQFELQKIHYELFKKTFLLNCSNCIKHAYHSVRIELTKTKIPMEKTNKLFEIAKGKGGISKQIHIAHDIITNGNLTDEKAIAILKAHPGHIVTFSKFPVNWKELVLNGLPTEKKLAEKETGNIITVSKEKQLEEKQILDFKEKAKSKFKKGKK